MDPTQLYETTIYNREAGNAFTFVTVPGRSVKGAEVPPVDVLAERLGFEPFHRAERSLSRIEPVEAWSLPFLIDASMGRWRGPDLLFEWRLYFDPPNRRGPSAFAQYLTYSPVIPFESSPLDGKALSELVTAGGVGAAVGAFATDHPLLLLAVPAGIIVCGAARGVADALRIGLRSRLLALMGVEDPEADEPPPDDE